MTSSLDVADAMETRFAVVPVDATIGDAVNILLATGHMSFPLWTRSTSLSACSPATR